MYIYIYVLTIYIYMMFLFAARQLFVFNVCSPATSRRRAIWMKCFFEILVFLVLFV